MKILYCGDIVGRSGRNVIIHHIKEVKEKYGVDVVIVNGENAAHGFGLSASIFDDLLKSGVDLVTTGNHIWQQRDIFPYLDNSSQIIRPLNYPDELPGRGYRVIEVLGKKVLVMQVLGRVFMPPVGSIAEAVEEVLKYYQLGKNADAILVDIHGEATSEKLSLGFYLDGRVSAVCGTHTHVPTSDARILENGTAYITDVGMCGDFNSVLGFEKEAPIERLVDKLTSQNRLKPANGNEAMIWGVVIEVGKDGKAVDIKQINEKFING